MSRATISMRVPSDERHAAAPAPFDPAAAGWERYGTTTGFIGLVGPFWSAPEAATATSTPSWPRPSTTTAAASCRAAC